MRGLVECACDLNAGQRIAAIDYLHTMLLSTDRYNWLADQIHDELRAIHLEAARHDHASYRTQLLTLESERDHLELQAEWLTLHEHDTVRAALQQDKALAQLQSLEARTAELRSAISAMQFFIEETLLEFTHQAKR